MVEDNGDFYMDVCLGPGLGAVMPYYQVEQWLEYQAILQTWIKRVYFSLVILHSSIFKYKIRISFFKIQHNRNIGADKYIVHE